MNKKNPMNPENIQPGDIVELLDAPGKHHTVSSVTGRFGNKVYCPKIGHEVYASCFRLIKKGSAK